MLRQIPYSDIENELNKEYSLFEYSHEGHCYRCEITPIGNFFMCMTDSSRSSFTYKLPLVPSYMLMALYDFFKYVSDTYNTEAAVQLFYDVSEDRFFLNLPNQFVTYSSVRFDRDYALETKYLLVADIHSHGKISAFFSSVDNADELGTRIFGVYGNLASSPSILFRAGSGGYFCDMPNFISQDNNSDEADNICDSLLENIDRITIL